MKTNISGLAITALLAASALTPAASGSDHGDQLSLSLPMAGSNLEEPILVFAPLEPAMNWGAEGSGSFPAPSKVDLHVNSSAAMDFVELAPISVKISLQDLAGEILPRRVHLAVYKPSPDEMASPARTRSVIKRGWVRNSEAVPEPAITFLGAFAGIILLLSRRRTPS